MTPARAVRQEVDNGILAEKYLTHWCLEVPREIVVCIYDTFDNNFEIENYFTKYLKKSCKLCSD